MSDTLTNALQQSSRSSSVLDGIAHPAVLNPLAGMGSAMDMVQKVQGLDKNQAVKAWGEVLQQATDPKTGVVDYPKAQALAAARPDAAYGMQEALRTTSALTGEQINNAAGHLKMVGSSAMTVANDPSDANINASFDNLKSSGMPAAQVEQERARWLAMSPAERQANAHRVGLTALDQLHQVVGQTTGQNIGGQIVPLTITQPSARGPGAVVQGPGAVTTTASPDTVVSLPDITWTATEADHAADPSVAVGSTQRMSGAERQRRFGNSGLLPPGAQEVPGTGGNTSPANRSSAVVRNSDGTKAGPNNPPRLLKLPTAPGATTPPAAVAPTAPAATPAAPVITPAPTAPAPPMPVVTAPPAPTVTPAPTPPAPAPAVAPTAPVRGARPEASLNGGGVQVASNALTAPTLGAPSPPNALVPSDVSAMQQGMDRARAGGAAPGTRVAGATFSTGPGIDEQGEMELSKARLTAARTAAANYSANAFPYTQALNLYGRGMTTAPTSDQLNNSKAWLGGALRSIGINTPISTDVEYYNGLQKWLANISSGNPLAARSDAGLAQTLAGNANTHIHELAGQDMLKAGMAITRMNAVASSEWDNMTPDQKAKYGYFSRFERELSKTIDPRAFAWDLYNDAQKKTLTEDLAAHRSDPAYAKRLLDSLNMARRNGLVTSQPAMP